MTGLPENIEHILQRLTENSKTELDIVRALADGIRRVDEQMLREVRSVALQHEVRREAIFGELQELASRLCVMPSRNVMTAINNRDYVHKPAAIGGKGINGLNGGGDWRQAAQKIDEELSAIFDDDGSRH
jgi:hypothetical protein